MLLTTLLCLQRDNVIVALPYDYSQGAMENHLFAARAFVIVIMAVIAVNAVGFFGGFSLFSVPASLFRASPEALLTLRGCVCVAIATSHRHSAMTLAYGRRRHHLSRSGRPHHRVCRDQQVALRVPDVCNAHLQRPSAACGAVELRARMPPGRKSEVMVCTLLL